MASKVEIGDEVSVTVDNPTYDAEYEPEDDNTLSEDEKGWRKLMGNKMYRLEIEDFKRRLFSDETAQTRFVDKVTFIFTVAAVIFLTYCISSPFGRAFIPYFFCSSTPLLIIIRYIQYKPRKWHYFLLDWCYWVNWSVMIYMLFFPSSGMMGTVLFAIALGPLPWTVIAYRNSIVFHSIEKFTSCYIHVMPMACLYAIKWFPEDCSRYWYDTFEINGEKDIALLLDVPESEVSWLYLAVSMPVVVTVLYFIQQAIEIWIINVLAKHSCCGKNLLRIYYDEEYLTLFRFSSTKGSGVIYKLINLFGDDNRLKMWMVINVIYTFVVSLPVYLFYWSQLANLLFAIIVVLWGTWNGANFYMESFARNYAGRRATRPKITKNDK